MSEGFLCATTKDKIAKKLIDGARFSIKKHEVIRCFPGGVTVRKIAKNFGHSAKTISIQRMMAFRKADMTSDVERFELKHTLIAP